MNSTNSISCTRIAFYARFSCDQQRETSIDDQLRRCRDLAERLGFSLDSVRIFQDEALSATSKHSNLRQGYQDLLAAWEAGEIDVIITDELSRLTRDVVEQAQLIRRLENNRRVRLITANGIDTALPNWQLQAGLVGLVNQQSTRDTQHRVTRGMVGQLERGYMIATPAFGYDLKREFDPAGNRLGTHWVINEARAALVREIFKRREAGQSMHQIARWLNDSGVETSRTARSSGGGYWRPSRVKDLLSNPIYRGEFVWHGSTTYRYRTERRGEEVEQQTFARPELRIVSDEAWYRCAEKKISRSGYGGGRHALAGLLSCGECGATLAVTSKSRCRSVYCANCTVEQSSLGTAARMTSTVATAGVEHLLAEALRLFVTEPFVEQFRASLREKLTGNNTAEIANVEAELSRMCRSRERLSRMLAGSNDEDLVLEQRYLELRESVAKTEARLAVLRAGLLSVDSAVIEAQLQADPREIIGEIFEADLAPEHLRALLSRLFPSIVLHGKESKYVSRFTIQFIPGSALALLSQTPLVDEGVVELCFRLRYRPNHRAGAATWVVELLGEAGAESAALDNLEVAPVVEHAEELAEA